MFSTKCCLNAVQTSCIAALICRFRKCNIALNASNSISGIGFGWCAKRTDPNLGFFGNAYNPDAQYLVKNYGTQIIAPAFNVNDSVSNSIPPGEMFSISPLPNLMAVPKNLLLFIFLSCGYYAKFYEGKVAYWKKIFW